MLSIRPAPLIRWTSIAAPIAIRLSSSAFLNSGCIFYFEEGERRAAYDCRSSTELDSYNPFVFVSFVIFVCFCKISLLLNPPFPNQLREPALLAYRIGLLAEIL